MCSIMPEEQDGPEISNQLRWSQRVAYFFPECLPLRVLPCGEHQQNLFSNFPMTWWILPCIYGKFEKKMRVVWKSQMPVGALALILEISYLLFC